MNIDTSIYEKPPHGSLRGTWTFEFFGSKGTGRQAVEGAWSTAKQWAVNRASELQAETILLVEGPGAGDGVSESDGSSPTVSDEPTACVVLKVSPSLALMSDNVPESHEVSQGGDLHLTLAYLGSNQTLDKTLIVKALADFAQKAKPVVGRVNGYGVFDTPDDRRAIHLLFDSPSLPEFRQSLVKALLKAGVAIDRKFGFIPHVTLAYAPKEGKLATPVTSDEPITLDSMQLYWGDDRANFSLKAGFEVLVPEDLQIPEEDEDVIERLPGGVVVTKAYDDQTIVVREPLGGLIEGKSLDEIMAKINSRTPEPAGAITVNGLPLEEAFKGEEHLTSDTLVAWGGPVKALGIKNGKGVLGGQLILYGATGEKDLTGDWFAEETYYGPRDGDGADTMMHHGIPLGKGMEEFADHLFSPLKAVRNKLGIWAEMACDLADEFEEKVYELGQKGVWKWSSGTADHMIKKDSTGQILRWPIIEGSLTPTPAEPRMLNHRMQPLKAFMDMDWVLQPTIEATLIVDEQLKILGDFIPLHDVGLSALALARRRRIRVR
jgi:2'-5' RNA ligase